MKKRKFLLPQACLLMINCFLIWHPAKAQTIAFQDHHQDKPRSYQQSEKNLSTVLTELEKKYKVSFSFDLKTIRDKKVSTDEKKQFPSLDAQLDYLLPPLHLLFEKLDAKLYLILPDKKQQPSTPVKSSAGTSSPSFYASTDLDAHTQKELVAVDAASVNITGTVTSASGEPLQKVSVLLKGTAIGTTTDKDGNYALSAPDGKGTLQFSLVGYIFREVEISDRSTVSISLEPDFRTMNDVVVIGYGTQKKKDLTGSIGTVSGTELNKIAVASVDQALQGKLAGVMVTTNSGEPGGATTVRVRGIGGFGNSEPLYVIDGVIITYSSSDAYSNPLATLNMADIESINVLKDASASAIYGARAGNGVVLITTKRGKIGKARINAEAYYGVQSVTRKMDLMNAKEIAQFSNDARTAAGLPIYGPFANPASLGEGVDWQDQIYRKAPMSNYQLSISGGNDKSQYFISGGYQNQEGIIKGSSFDRYSLRVNLDNQLTSWLKMGNNLTISRTSSNSLTNVGNNDKYDGVVAIALRRSPTLPIYNPDGTWAGTPGAGVSYMGNVPNPLRIATELYNPNERIRGLGNIFFDIKLMKDLTFRTSLGIDYVLINASGFQKQVTEESVQDLSRSAYSSKTTNSNILSENTLNYKKVFGGRHSVDVLAGYTAQKATYENVYAYSENHLNDVLTTVDAGSSIGRLASGSKSIVSYVSYLARVNYAFDGKYLLTANIRRDGASVFSSENKFAVFPSFSAGWRISKEKFMEHMPAISNLMLRGSWGQTGIDGSLGVGAEYASMGTGYLYNFNGVPVNGMVQTSIPNTSLKWETVTQTDFGFDLGLFSNRVTVTADYFSKHFSDMIEQRPIPSYFGIWDGPWAGGSITQATNGATVVNKGFEFSLNYDNQAPGGSFNYSLGVNLTTYSNKVVELASPTSGGAAGVNVIQGNLTRTEKGHSVGEFYGYIVDGIFQSKDEILKSPTQNANTAPGDYKFRDVNNDNKIDDNDKAFIGSPIPDLAYGIIGDLSYKQFDLNFSFQGVSGNEIVNVNKFMTESGSSTENKSRTMLNRWTASNPQATYARAISTDPNFNDRFSTRHVEDGSFFRLRNIQLGYKLPAHLINKISLSNVRIYLSAQNVFTITNYSGYNPDIGSQKQSNASSGLDNTIYPQARSIIGGIQIGF